MGKEEEENGFAPGLGWRRSSHRAVLQIRQLNGATTAVFRRQDGTTEQLRQQALAAGRLWRSRGHVAAILTFQQLFAGLFYNSSSWRWLQGVGSHGSTGLQQGFHPETLRWACCGGVTLHTSCINHGCLK
ncbi:unnamed protein product [Prunus armeniaca]